MTDQDVNMAKSSLSQVEVEAIVMGRLESQIKKAQT